MVNEANNMQLGMPTLIENKNLSESATLCEELGLDFVELNMNLPQYQVESIGKIRELLEIAKLHHIFYTIHLDENINVCDFNGVVAKAWIETVISTIRIAKKLHAPVLNMHMNYGVYFTLPHKRVYLFEEYKDTYLQKLKEFRYICENEIGDDHILISIENTDGYMPFQKDGIDLLLESKVFSLTWDIGHSHSAGKLDEEYIISKLDRLRHFHIHDAKGTHNHLILGSGEIDLNSRLELAKRTDCRCVVETKTVEALRQSIKWLRKNGDLCYI